jgi:purine-nucleoside phosphorylase
MTKPLFDQIQESVDKIRERTPFLPFTGIILGTGLGNLTDEMNIVAELDYSEIPHFPRPTVESHRGKLVFGFLSEKPVVVMAGRFHFYEGYSMQQVTFPVRVLKFLGIQQLFITNVSGGTNPHFKAGDLVFVNDHINLQPENPLRGENDERLGPRFPDMLETYDKTLIYKALDISKKNYITAHEGVYTALSGPNLETPAEYNFIHKMGGDLVGMSTVPEVLVARHMNLPVFVCSLVSNACFPTTILKKTTLESVIAVAVAAEPKMRLVLKELLKMTSP